LTSPPIRASIGSLILKNVTSSWAVLVVNALASFFLSPIVVHSLGSVYYGIWTLLNQFTGYLWLFDFGVRESVVKYVAQYHASGDRARLEATIRTAISVYAVVSAGVLAVVVVLAGALPYVFNIPADAVPAARMAAFVIGANVAQLFLTNVFVGALMGLQRIYRVSQVTITNTVLRVAGTYVLLSNGYGIVALALMYLGLSLLYAAFVMRLCRVYLPDVPLRPSRPERAEVAKLFNYGKYVLLANIGDKIIFASDAIVIGMFLPIAALTPYAIAGTLIETMRSVVKAISSVFNPLTSSLHATGQRAALQRVLVSGAKGALIVGLPICIGFITLGERFVRLWMGEAHAEMAGNVLKILATGYIVGLPYYTMSGILYGLSAHRVVAILRVIEGAINLVLSVVLINVIGLVGVAAATALPHVVMVGWVLPRALPRVFPVNLREYYVAAYGRTLLAAIPFALACVIVEQVVQPASLPGFLLWGIVIFPAYIGPVWLLALSADDRGQLARALGRRPGARAR
jgi:O-antigen/teichoic acid export membrane protein